MGWKSFGGVGRGRGMVYGRAADRTRDGERMQERLEARAAFLEVRKKAAAELREDARRNPQRCGRRLPGTPGYSCGLEACGTPVIGGPATAESPDSTAEAAAYWLCAEHIGELQGACKGRQPDEAEAVQAWLDDNVMPGVSRTGPDSVCILYAAFCDGGDDDGDGDGASP